MISKTTVLGAAGEHYVMCQLLRRGLIAALAPVGVPNTDIIVTDAIGDRTSAIQVKTRVEKGTDGGWHMSKKHEKISSPSLFYAFVDFGADLESASTCYIVPSLVVADVIAKSHRAWLAAPGKKGQAHKDSDFRRFLPNYPIMGPESGHGPGWLKPFREAWGVFGGG